MDCFDQILIVALLNIGGRGERLFSRAHLSLDSHAVATGYQVVQAGEGGQRTC